MTIGIDIDDTMTNTTELMLEYAEDFFKEKDKNELINVLHSKIEGKVYDFYMNYLPIITPKYTLKNNVLEVIKRFRQNGHKVIIITARGHSTFDGLIDITKEYIIKKNIVVDGIIYKCGNKTEACRDNKIDIMIDDSISVLNQLKEKNVNVLLFNSIVNKNIDCDFDRIDTWLELEEYINKLGVTI